MKHLCLLFVLLLFPIIGSAQTVIFGPCGGSWNSGSCTVNNSPYPTPSADFFNVNGTTGLTSTSVQLVPANGSHSNWDFVYANAVNDQYFVTTFDFYPNGFNLSFGLNNAYTPGGSFDFPWAFGAGAGGEGGCQQNAQSGGTWYMPYNVFCLQLDSYNGLTNSASFTYSSAQIYANPQTIYMPITTGNSSYVPEYPTNKISTSPVALNSPTTSPGSPSTDEFEATIIYNGNNVTLLLYDVTSGGTCSPITSGTCFSYTWQGVNIPGIAGGPWTNYIGGTNGTGGVNAWPFLAAGTSGGFTEPALQILNWTYSTLSQAATPSCSPGSGTYGSTQSVTCTDSSSGSIMCASTQGPPTTDGNGNCLPGSTKYTGAISVANGQTLQVVAGSGTSQYGDSVPASYTYVVTGTAAAPVFNPPSGTYQGTQNLYLTVPAGQTAHYNTTGSPTCSSTAWTTPISVSSNETVYAVSCGSGLTTSPVSSAAYILNPFAGSGAPTPAASPTLSPIGGSYGSAQTVTMTCPTTGTNGTCGCYTVGTSRPTIPPQPDGGRAMNTSSASPPSGCGCQSGTLYSGPFSVSSTSTVYASCGTSFQTMSSSLIEVPYTIGGGGSATAPTCTPTSSTSVGAVFVTCTNPNSGTTIMCYTENGTTPVTNGSGTGCSTGTSLSGASNTITISSTVTTLEVVAGTSALSDSTASSYGAYTINTTGTTTIKGIWTFKNPTLVIK